MPFILLILSIATLATVASKAKAAPARPKGTPQTFTLDASMPETLRNQVLAALVSGTDPNAIDAFATAIQMDFPLAAAALHAKAVSLRAGIPAPPQLPSLPQPATQPQPGRAQPGGQPQQPAIVDPGGPPLDANIPPSVAALVHSELANDRDPMKLLALANQLAAQYPIASGMLVAKAAALSAPQQPTLPVEPSAPPQAPPANPPAPALGMPGLDPGMPPEVAQEVMGALISENDPTKLQALALQLQGQFPKASMLLAMKANTLLALTHPQVPVTPAAPSVPSTPKAPATPANANPAAPVVPVTPSAPTPTIPIPSTPAAPSAPATPASGPTSLPTNGLDVTMPPELAQMVLNELANEADPVKLQALADQLAPQYPIAATLLRTRANVILVTRPPALIIPGSPSTPPPPGVVTTMYTVQKGDFAWKIAEKHTGHGARWPELVAANPAKKKAADGNFASLLPGEKLNVPPSWASAQPSLAAPTVPPLAAPSVVVPPVPAPVAPANSNATSALDPNIPADVAAAVLTALQTASDPNQLRGFATAIAQQFPVAAALLTAKANTLGGFAAPQLTQTTFRPNAPPALPSAAGNTYKVKAGDNPSKIAAALVHDGNRWKELVAANPTKKRAKDGNFASLQPGEVLQLPPSWPAAPNGAAKPNPMHLPQGGV